MSVSHTRKPRNPMTTRIVSAADIPFRQFTHLLNESYQDYYMPLDMDVRQLRERVARDDIDLVASKVALRDGLPVGLGMLAQRGLRGWIGGVGVLREHRRKGVGRQLMDALIASARSNGVQQLQLEVIQQNKGALALYETLGFKRRRVLHVAEGKPTPRRTPVKLQAVPVEAALKFFDAFHPVTNPWQRERIAIERLSPRLTAVVAIEVDTVVAYAIGVFRVDVVRFVDLGCKPDAVDVLRSLVLELHRQHPLTPGSIINLPEDDPAWNILAALGYMPYLSQYEMILPL